MKYWNKRIQTIEPYTAGEQPKHEVCIKLNTNENPHAPSPKVQRVLASYDARNFRRYPDPRSNKLREALARYHNVHETQIFISNGSDEALALIYQTFFDAGDIITRPEISYSFYPVYAAFNGLQEHVLPMRSDFRVDIDAFCRAQSAIILANPNAPTSLSCERIALESIISSNQEHVVVIDEAYIDYGGATCIPLISTYKNLLVVRTFSKSRQLAGLRLGYVIGDAQLIEGLERCKNAFNSYTIDMLSEEVGVVSLEDEVYFQMTREKVIQVRSWFSNELRNLGYEVLESSTNFVFVKPSKDANVVFETLKSNGIYVRHFNLPKISAYLRITIGTSEEMKVCLEALQRIE